MSETRPGGEAEQRLEHTTEELDHDLERLGDHIDDAQKKAEDRRVEANPAEAVAGDWDETRGAPGQGEDPEGAVPDGDAEGATERDATEGDAGEEGRGAVSMSAAEADRVAEEHHED
jgi:hypothetical protein